MQLDNSHLKLYLNYPMVH